MRSLYGRRSDGHIAPHNKEKINKLLSPVSPPANPTAHPSVRPTYSLARRLARPPARLSGWAQDLFPITNNVCELLGVSLPLAAIPRPPASPPARQPAGRLVGLPIGLTAAGTLARPPPSPPAFPPTAAHLPAANQYTRPTVRRNARSLVHRPPLSRPLCHCPAHLPPTRPSIHSVQCFITNRYEAKCFTLHTAKELLRLWNDCLRQELI